jgi:hypothetical protein
MSDAHMAITIPIVSATQLLHDLKEPDSELLCIFVNEILTEQANKPIIKEIQDLINEYKDWFPISQGNQFANLPPGVPPSHGPHDHAIPLKDPNANPFFRHP